MFTINVNSTKQLKFDVDKVQPFTKNFYDIIPSMFHYKLHKLAPAGIYKVTYDEYRPDLVSYQIYGHVQYKMILMEYNDIISINKLKAGTIIKYPSLKDMETLFLQLKYNL